MLLLQLINLLCIQFKYPDPLHNLLLYNTYLFFAIDFDLQNFRLFETP